MTPRRKADDQSEFEDVEGRQGVREKVLEGLSKLLNMDRDVIAGALDELAAKKRAATPEEETAQRFGMHIANAGPGRIIVTSTLGETMELANGKEMRVLPKQFALRQDVPNLPYHAIGVLPNCFLNVRIEARDRATLRVDWSKLYQNAGLWGNIRLVKRLTARGQTEVTPLRELKTEVIIDAKAVVEITGMGLGVDLMGDMSMLRRELSTRQGGPAAAAAAHRRAEAFRSGQSEEQEE